MFNTDDLDSFSYELRQVQKSIDSGFSDNILKLDADRDMFFDTLKVNLAKAEEKEDFLKSFSGDLSKKFPNAQWRTINGAKVLINNGKVVAGLNGFNDHIDKFFSDKKAKQSEGGGGEKKKESDYLSEQKEISRKIGDHNTKKLKEVNVNVANLKAMLKNGNMDVDKTIRSQGQISDQWDSKVKKLAPQAKMAEKYPNDKSLQDIRAQYDRAVRNKKEADELLNTAMDFKRNQQPSKDEGKKESKEDTHYKDMPKKVAEETAQYWGNKKMDWNSGKTTMSKEDQQKLKEVQQGINKYHPEFNKYLSKMESKEGDSKKEEKPKSQKLSPRAKSILKDSKQLFLRTSDPKKLQSMMDQLKTNIGIDEQGKKNIGMGLDEDMVAAGKAFLNDKDIKEHLEFITKPLKEPKQFTPKTEEKPKASNNVSTKTTKDLDTFGKQKLDNEKTETISKLSNLASKIDEKYLSSETKDKLSKLVNDIYIDGGFGSHQKNISVVDDIYNAKNIKDSLSALKKLNNRLTKEDSYALEEDMVNKIQSTLVEAAKEQLNKKTTEKKNYKLF